MSTKAEVIQRIGEELGLVPIGQVLEAQDVTRIGQDYSAVYQRIKEDGLASWASEGDIPDKIVPYFCLLVEFNLLLAYSVPESRYLRISNSAGQNGDLALANLASIVTQEYDNNDGYQDF